MITDLWVQSFGVRSERVWKNHIFWSEIGSGFWEPCGTPLPKILGSSFRFKNMWNGTYEESNDNSWGKLREPETADKNFAQSVIRVATLILLVSQLQLLVNSGVFHLVSCKVQTNSNREIRHFWDIRHNKVPCTMLTYHYVWSFTDSLPYMHTYYR